MSRKKKEPTTVVRIPVSLKPDVDKLKEEYQKTYMSTNSQPVPKNVPCTQ